MAFIFGRIDFTLKVQFSLSGSQRFLLINMASKRRRNSDGSVTRDFILSGPLVLRVGPLRLTNLE